MRRDARNAHHLGTVSHAGRFWDAYLEVDESAGRGAPLRGRIAFSAPGEAEDLVVRTAAIFIENSPQDVLDRARELKTHQLIALLRSSMPDPPAADSAPGEPSEADDSREESPSAGTPPASPPTDPRRSDP